MTMGERIKRRREELELTQTDLAKRMGYKSRAAICNIEKDKEDLTTARISKLAKALETTPAYLMGWDEKVVKEEINIEELIPKEVMKDPETLAGLKDLIETYLKITPEQRSNLVSLLKSLQPKV